MPETIKRTDAKQIIAGVFSKREKANDAIQEFRNLGVSDEDIQVVFKDVHTQEVYLNSFLDRDIIESQALYYVKAVEDGKVVVAIHNVTDPATVIDVFDRFHADYNLDGSRNLREDVAGMTVGTAVGTVALGAAGATLAGPLGGVVGAAAGAVLGAGAGAVAGKDAEHRK